VNVVVKSAFQVWDDVTHGGDRYPHGPGGLVIVPLEVATPLEHTGGYRRATAEDLENEIVMLEDRAQRLRAHRERL
jgi:hypothetical protein